MVLLRWNIYRPKQTVQFCKHMKTNHSIWHLLHDNNPSLKKKHIYFSQCRGVMAIFCQLSYLDFVVFTQKDLHVERIYFDKHLGIKYVLTNFFLFWLYNGAWRVNMQLILQTIFKHIHKHYTYKHWAVLEMPGHTRPWMELKIGIVAWIRTCYGINPNYITFSYGLFIFLYSGADFSGMTHYRLYIHELNIYLST